MACLRHCRRHTWRACGIAGDTHGALAALQETHMVSTSIPGGVARNAQWCLQASQAGSQETHNGVCKRPRRDRKKRAMVSACVAGG